MARRTDIGSLVTTMALDDAQYHRDLAKASQGVKSYSAKTNQYLAKAEQSWRGMTASLSRSIKSHISLGAVITSVAGAGGLGYLTKRTIESTAEIERNAKMAGVSTKAFQELSYVAGRHQITQEALTDGLKELNLRIDEYVQTGAGPAKEAIERLGFTQFELNQKLKDAPALLRDIIKSMEGLDTAAKLRIADEIFGGQGGEQFVAMINAGAKSLDGFTSEAHRLGLVIDESLINQSVEAKKEIETLTNVLSAQFATVIADLAPQITKASNAVVDWIAANNEFIKQDIPNYIDKTTSSISALIDLYNKIPDDFLNVIGMGIGGLPMLLNEYNTRVLKSLSEFTDKGTEIDVLTKKINELKFSLSSWESQLEKRERFSFLPFMGEQIVEAESNIELIKKEIQSLEKEIELFSIADMIPDPTGIDNIGESANKTNDKIKTLSKSIKKLAAGENVISAEDIFSEDAAKEFDKFFLENMDKTTDAYKQLFILKEMDIWKAKKGITEDQLKDINAILIKNMFPDDSEVEDKTIEITRSINDIFESSLSNVLTDALTGQLDTVLDYSQSIVNSMASMWSAQMAKMVFNPGNAAAFGLSGGAAFGAMGIAGLAIGGISKALGDRQAKKAREAELRRRRNALNATVEDSIAQLEMSEIGYEIFQTTKKLADMAKEARKTGANLERLNELRALEIDRLEEESKAYYEKQLADAAAPFDTIIDRFQNFTIKRNQSDWTIADWQAEFNALESQLENLSFNDEEYFNVAEKQLEALMTIIDLSEEQLKSYESTQKSLNSQIWDLTYGGMAGTTSISDYQLRYSQLFEAAKTLEVSAIEDFQGFINDFISVMSTEGFDYNELTSKITDDLATLSIELDDPIKQLKEAIEGNTGAIAGDGGLTGSIEQMTNALIGQMEIDRQIAMFQRFSSVAGELNVPSMPTGMKPIEWGPGANGFDFGYARTADGGLTAAGESADETALMNQIDAWKSFGGALSALFETVDMSMFNDEQLKNISKWKDFIRTMPERYDPFEESTLESAKLYSEWLRWFDKEIPENIFSEMKYEYPNIPMAANGMWSNSPAIFGETGDGEWAIPDYKNPRNDNFLKSVGSDPETLGKAIVREIMPMLNKSGGEKTIIIPVNINEREIAKIVVNQARIDHELRETIASI